MRYFYLVRVGFIFMLCSCLTARAQENTAGDSAVKNSGNTIPIGITWKQQHQLEKKSEAAKKDLEIALLKETELSRARLWTSLTVTVLFVNLLVILFTVRHHLKRRRVVEAEKKLKEFELQETKTRLYHNTKLVDGFTQRILDKNKIIAELERKIRSNPLFNQSTEAAKKNLEAISEIRILTNEDWEKFQSNINKVYPGLINRICDSFPLITDAELRMFLLIKLSVKNKDVSEILGISPDSVRKTRFRLKKKLNLGEEADLDDFITDYSGSENIVPKEKLN